MKTLFWMLAALGIMPLFPYSIQAAEVPIVSTGPVTLQECYQRALRVSETLAISEATIRALEAQYRQGVSAVLPSLSWIKTQEFQDTPSDTASSSNTVQSSLLRSPIPQSYFELDQPLFHGLREFNALKAFKSARASGEKSRDQARLNVLSDVAQVFYTSVDLQQELDLYGHEHQITEDRIKQLQHWVDLGRSSARKWTWCRLKRRSNKPAPPFRPRG
jgi:outer membrane protein TolC